MVLNYQYGGETKMGKLSDFVFDFLGVIGDHKQYDKHNWDWDNLPPIEKMWEIVEKHRGKNK